METTEQKREKPLLARMAERLLEAQREIDELALQLALGKAKARDKFEEIKKNLQARLRKAKQALADDDLPITLISLRSKLEELEVQLALGKAETRQAFEVQREKISKAIRLIEAEINERLPDSFHAEQLIHDLEKFKLKLEILRLKFELKKFEVKDVFRDNMNDAKKRIDNVLQKASDTLEGGKAKYSDFRDEIHLAYKHLRKALESF